MTILNSYSYAQNIDRRYMSTQNICYSEKKKIMFIPYIVSVENIFSLKTSIAVLTVILSNKCRDD